MEKLQHLSPLKLPKALILAAVFSLAFIGAAQADSNNNHNKGNHYGNNRNARIHYNNRQWRQHENNNRRYWQQRHYVPEHTVVYAPPAYYYPEPVYQSPGLNFIFPLRIR